MVVDDEPDSLDVARRLLKMYGADVIMADNGQTGIELALKHYPRFIISDLSMPGTNGWAMLNILKRTPTTKDIPVIALTAHAMPGDRAQAFGAGFHNHLTKPLKPETFVRDVLNLLMDIPEIANALIDHY